MPSNTPTLRELPSLSTQPPRSQSTPAGLGCRTGHRGPLVGPNEAISSFDTSEGTGESSASARPPTLRPRGSVLVLATDPAVTSAVQRVLEDAYDVVACNDPIEALVGFVRGDEYDVVLCDVRLPFVPSGEFRDRVAAMNQALSERIVTLTFEESEPGSLGTQISKQLDISQMRARIDEFVQLRTMPPSASFRVHR